MKNTKFEALKYLKARNYEKHFTKKQIDTMASDLVMFARQINKNDCIGSVSHSFMIMRDSWLKPNGQIIEVGDFQHNEYAREILEAEMGMEKLHDYMNEHNCQSATEVLHERGWVRIKYNTAYLPRIKILGSYISLVRPERNTIDPRMNSKQLRVAKQLCEDNDTTLHVAVNDKRFW